MLIPAKKSNDKRAATSGSIGDGLANGAEFAGTILVFTLFGYILDRIFDAKPWFILGFTVFGIVGQFVRTWYTYDAKMKAHEAERVAKINATPRRPAVESSTSNQTTSPSSPNLPKSAASGAASVRSNGAASVRSNGAASVRSNVRSGAQSDARSNNGAA